MKCLKRSNSGIHIANGCNPKTKHFVCKTHELHHLVCRCPKTVQNRTDMGGNAKKGSFFCREIIFNTESVQVETKNGKTLTVVLNYDSWASDSSAS